MRNDNAFLSIDKETFGFMFDRIRSLDSIMCRQQCAVKVNDDCTLYTVHCTVYVHITNCTDTTVLQVYSSTDIHYTVVQICSSTDILQYRYTLVQIYFSTDIQQY